MNLKAGETLQSGKYVIIQVLGQGGFGITYLVRHTLLNTNFALKEFFPQDYCTRDGSTSRVDYATQSCVDLVDKLRMRFISEARNIASLRHPNIIGINDVFEENGTAYFVMEYIDGYSLEDLVKLKGAVPEPRAVEIALKISSALDYIHRRKMTHYDVKPANVMVRSSDGEPVLIDFGLSKQYNDEGHAQSTLLVGLSHGYSPLEQYFNKGGDSFMPRSDIYSLGATLYTLVSGRVPPEAPRLVAQVIEVPENISAPVANAIKWAMASDAGMRCPSANKFSQMLLSNGDMEDTPAPVEDMPTVRRHVSEPSPRKSRDNGSAAVWIGSLVGVLLLAGIFVFLFSDSGSSGSGTTTAVVGGGKKGKSGSTDNQTIDTRQKKNSGSETVAADGSRVIKSGPYEFKGTVSGRYDVIYKLDFTDIGDGTYRVSGKYAYQSTLRNYGDVSSSWFYLNGYYYSNNNFITTTETTPSNPDYLGSFEGQITGSVMSGDLYSNVPGAEQCYVHVVMTKRPK